jgi:hypothetical protein
MISAFKTLQIQALLLVGTLLALSGCNTLAPKDAPAVRDGRSAAPMTSAGHHPAIGGSGVPSRISKMEPSSKLSALADQPLPLPLKHTDSVAFDAALSNALLSDLRRIISGALDAPQLAVDLNRIIMRYEKALLQTLERMERDVESARPESLGWDYEQVVGQWMRVSDRKERAAAFVSWAESVMHGYDLDLQLSGERTAGVNLRAEVESYLW